MTLRSPGTDESILDLEFTVSWERQRPSTAEEHRSWKKLDGGCSTHWDGVDCHAQSREKEWGLIMPSYHSILYPLPKRSRNKEITKFLKEIEKPSAASVQCHEKFVSCLLSQPGLSGLSPSMAEGPHIPTRVNASSFTGERILLGNTSHTCWVVLFQGLNWRIRGGK